MVYCWWLVLSRGYTLSEPCERLRGSARILPYGTVPTITGVLLAELLSRLLPQEGRLVFRFSSCPFPPLATYCQAFAYRGS